MTELDAVRDWGSIRKEEVAEPGSVTITARGPYSVNTRAGVYRPPQAAPAPAVIIQHGSYPWGRKGGLVRLLASRLADNGFFVIAPDARGFGDSDDPRNINDPESWRTAADLTRTIDYLLSTELVDADNIFVLGHSMGANHALEGGLTEDRVKALILIGPGRFTGDEDTTVSRWVRTRFSADRRLERPISVDAALFAYSLGNLRLLAREALTDPNHKPILLIDGEKEGAAKLEYVAEIINRLEGPIEYHTLPGTGHYCGVRSFYGADNVYFQPRMFLPFFDVLLEFLRRQIAEDGATGAGPSTLL